MRTKLQNVRKCILYNIRQREHFILIKCVIVSFKLSIFLEVKNGLCLRFPLYFEYFLKFGRHFSGTHQGDAKSKSILLILLIVVDVFQLFANVFSQIRKPFLELTFYTLLVVILSGVNIQNFGLGTHNVHQKITKLPNASKEHFSRSASEPIFQRIFS